MDLFHCAPGFAAATFGFDNKQSYLHFTIPPEQRVQLQSKVDVSLFFRTRKPSGLIFYLGSDPATSPVTYIAAFMQNGNLMVILSWLFSVGQCGRLMIFSHL